MKQISKAMIQLSIVALVSFSLAYAQPQSSDEGSCSGELSQLLDIRLDWTDSIQWEKEAQISISPDGEVFALLAKISQPARQSNFSALEEAETLKDMDPWQLESREQDRDEDIQRRSPQVRNKQSRELILYGPKARYRGTLQINNWRGMNIPVAVSSTRIAYAKYANKIMLSPLPERPSRDESSGSRGLRRPPNFQTLRLVHPGSQEDDKPYSISNMTFSRDGRYLAVNYSYKGSLYVVWDLSENPPKSWRIEAKAVFPNLDSLLHHQPAKLKFTSDNKVRMEILYEAPFKNGMIFVKDWDFQKAEVTEILRAEGANPLTLSSSANLAVLQNEMGVYLQDFRTPARQRPLMPGTYAISADDRLLFRFVPAKYSTPKDVVNVIEVFRIESLFQSGLIMQKPKPDLEVFAGRSQNSGLANSIRFFLDPSGRNLWTTTGALVELWGVIKEDLIIHDLTQLP